MNVRLGDLDLSADDLVRSILNSSLDCIKILDRGGGLMFMNEPGMRAMEIDEFGAFRGGYWPGLWENEGRARAEQALEKARGGEPARFEAFCRTIKGNPRWWDVIITPLSFAGELAGFLSISRDITGQRALQDQLEQANQRYRALVEASTDMLWRASPDGQLTQASSRWEDLVGCSEGSYSGLAWLDCVHPDDREIVAAVWRDLTGNPRPGRAEYRVRSRDGSYRWVSARAVPLCDSDGRIREWVGSATDIHERKMAEHRLVDSEERYRLAARATTDAIWDWDLASDTIRWSEKTYELFGYSTETIGGCAAWWLACIHPDDRARVEAAAGACITSTAERFVEEYRFRRADGSYAHVLDRGFLVRGRDGRPTRMVGALQDVTELHAAGRALAASEERLRMALRAGRMVAWEHDLRTGIVERSDTAGDLLGIGTGPLALFVDRVVPEDRQKLFAEPGKPGRSRFAEVRYRHPDGRLLWLGVRSDTISADRQFGITFDISDRKEAEETIWRIANTDHLTGLPNRASFHKRFDEALGEARKTRGRLGLLLLDLDNFKDVNDTLGHEAGDILLRETAARLVDLVGPGGTVARIGGDEFATILPGYTLGEAVTVAKRLEKGLREPLSYGERSIETGASIGVACFPDHHASAEELLRDADIALYEAKANQRNRVGIFSSDARQAVERRIAIARDLRAGLGDRRIVPFYQPKVNLRSREVVGFEALARWRHPTKGLLTPSYFGSAFENLELATALSNALLNEVLGDIRRWLDKGHPFGRIAFNLSAAEFTDGGLADGILAAMEAHRVPADCVEVEITETVFLGRDADLAARVLSTFSTHGVRIALDDFGTGFASLTHLKQFPVDHLKIDQSFIRDLGKGGSDEAIIAAVIGLARTLGMEVTAEGVEEPEQERRLALLGCDNAQGFLYARPMVGSRVPWFLRSRREHGLEPARTRRA